jgi:hypothetical protein
MNSWFEELSSSHQEWVELTRKINFEKGIRLSTVEKYPDPVHFVYELLQNAEDQDASEAQFQLTPTHLVFCHNGNPFTRQDVENITGIGNSNKQQEANKIGRFGMGFKSVFAITQRPEIYTEMEGKPFAFAIEDLVVPVDISGDPERHHQFKTRFLFPFIQGQERSLYMKIRERLSSLGLEALLFLKHLASVAWETETDYGVYLREVKGSCYELCGESGQGEQIQRISANYLVFSKEVNLSDSDRAVDVRIAFRLDEKGKIRSEKRSPNLAVYFPTEQPTGLNFRVHGPFLLTDNRASIKLDNDTNNQLIQECAVLLGESILQIKEEGLLTVDFLSLLPLREDNIQELFLPLYDQVLPLREDNIQELFLPLYDQVLQMLEQYPLLPTADGMFARATQVKLAGSADLRELQDKQQLSMLYGSRSSLHWLPAEITADRMPDLYRYLRRGLQIEEIDPEDFVQEIEIPFLEQQTDEWLIKLYIFLSKQPGLRDIIGEKPILRLEDNSHVSPFSASYDWNDTPNAYLLREGESKFPLVKRALLADDIVYAFLKGIGLSEPDIIDEVLGFILPPYEKGEVALDDEGRNSQDLHHIQGALKCTGHRARQELIDKLNETPFLQAINAKTSERAWKAPCEVYSPTEELLTWFEGNEQAWFIAGSLPGSLCNDLNIRSHLQPKAATGYAGYVTIRNWHGDHQRGLRHFDPNVSLEGLDHALDFITPDKARMLWKILLEYHHLIKGIVETSTHQDFSNPRKEKKLSSIGRLCSQKAWLPDKDGYFCVPQELFLTDLPEDFEKDIQEAQEVATKLGMRKAEELQLADKLGIPHEDISLILHNLEAVRAWCEQQQTKAALPSSIANDPARRQAKAAEAAHAAEVKTYKPVTINRRISAGYSEPRIYLRGHNTNEEGQLICQLCDQPMPFRLPNGEEYFVAYQYIDLIEKEYDANHLALCPNCAAEFQYACQTDESKRAELILGMNMMTEEKNLVIGLDMPVHQRLRFTQNHLMDLQKAIKDWLKTDSSMGSRLRDGDIGLR